MTVEDTKANDSNSIMSVKNKENEDEDVVIDETVTSDGLQILSLKLLPLVRNLQSKHGLRHGDYQRYRGYCSRRLARLRKVLKLVQGNKGKRFTKKEMTVDALRKATPELAVEGKHLQLPLMAAERAWAYAMQLKFEMNSEPRKKYHMQNRLRKAKSHAEQLVQLVMAEGAPVDARTKLEAQAYAVWMTGILCFELSDWVGAKTALTEARNIYDKLATITSVDDTSVYRSRMDEIVPSLRYCAYNIGDASAKMDISKDLKGLRGHIQDTEQLDELIRETREQQAATLQDVEWRGRKMAVIQDKARTFLLREKEFLSEISEVSDENAERTTDDKISAYESLLMDCKEAIEVLKKDLIEDPAFRNRQQTNEGPVSPMHFLHTYLTFIKCSKIIDRNLVMIDSMKKVLAGESPQQKGKKPIKPNDLVRLYENILQNLKDMPHLAGLEDDLEFHHETEAKVTFYKATRCYYIALSFMAAQKWAESMALFERVVLYANKAKNDKLLDASLRTEVKDLLEAVEGRQFMAHANSILESEAAKLQGQNAIRDEKEETKENSRKPLLERLDTYYEDPNLTNGKPNLAQFPPNFHPIPCKPLFFDLAREHISFPDLQEKMKKPGQEEKQDSSNWWGWAWGAKK